MDKLPKYNSLKVDTLYKLAQQYSATNANRINNDFDDWSLLINESNTVDLIALTAKLSSKDDEPSRKIKALRESVIPQIA